MIKGIYSAYSAMEAAWRYQDILANNVANANTTGYRRETASRASFADVLLTQQSPTVSPIATRIDDIVGQIGTGTFVANFSTDLAGGVQQRTGMTLDFTTEKGFFQVQTPDGTPFYTRDGRFQRDGTGDLVTNQGYYVLSATGGHINLSPDTVSVASDGTISQGEQVVDQFSILQFAGRDLQRAGEAYFTSTAQGVQIDGNVRQGYIENSNTKMEEELTSLMAVQRTFQANQTIFSLLDASLNQAVQLGVTGAA
jgi:flagellar basal-body rod protein FlgG